MTKWKHIGFARSYSVFSRESQITPGETVFQATYGEAPSDDAGGYYQLDGLLRLKGVPPSDFERNPTS